MQWTIDQDYAFVYLGWFGPTLTARRIFDRFWGLVDESGVPRNPYRVGFVQNVVVPRPTSGPRSSTDATSRTRSVRVSGACPALHGSAGYVDPRGVEAMLRDPGDFGLAAELHHATFGRLAEARSVIAGSPATVRDQILEFVEEFRIGNLLVMLQMGGMPHDLTMKNIHLFAEEVMPHLQIGGGRRLGEPWWPTVSAAAGEG